MTLLVSTWASKLKEKNLGGEASTWRNGELSSWEAKLTIFLSL